jgi:hypothetical protein
MTGRSTVAGAGSLCSGVRLSETYSSAAIADEREGDEGKLLGLPFGDRGKGWSWVLQINGHGIAQ